MLEILDYSVPNRTSRSDKKPQLIYVADPMCSWCYGFAPEISRLKGSHDELVDFKLVMGGLRTGSSDPMNAQLKEMVARHWEQVHDVSGQPFNYHFLHRNDFVYDTEPACRAMVAVRHLKPKLEFEIFKDMQRQFYAEATDITQLDSLLEIMLDFGINEDEFIQLFNSEKIKEETQDDFDLALGMGVESFPTVLLMDDSEELHLITKGYRTYEQMVDILDSYLPRHQHRMPYHPYEQAHM
ncbi:MAG: DsbA family protein [Hymenobacteraceae bacterium]|nr:DsbA family protein [Hymenobacteraceae bacterium]MDX5395656.1 DsbA family protein [Hymenobacteraceae bacterium]MDX5511710.1 DsbA family protein [Hymenobacteraceae bacterium]